MPVENIALLFNLVMIPPSIKAFTIKLSVLPKNNYLCRLNGHILVYQRYSPIY